MDEAPSTELEPLEFVYTLEACDIADASRALLPANLIRVLGSFLFIVSAVSSLQTLRGDPDASPVKLALFVAAYIGAYLWLFTLLPRRALRQIPEAERDVRVRLTDDGVVVKARNSEVLLSWRGLARVRRIRNGYAFRFTNGGFHYVPGRVLDSVQQASLVAWVRRAGKPIE